MIQLSVMIGRKWKNEGGSKCAPLRRNSAFSLPMGLTMFDWMATVKNPVVETILKSTASLHNQHSKIANLQKVAYLPHLRALYISNGDLTGRVLVPGF